MTGAIASSERNADASCRPSSRSFRARRCRHVRVDPRIADEELDELYDDRYYRGGGFDATIDYSAPPTEATRGENADIIDSVSEAAGGSIAGRRWLDVGCGTGTLLEQARERGAIVTGLDSSTFAMQSCAQKGLPILAADEAGAGNARFDIVSAIEVIEHVPDPLGFLKYLASHVRDGGVVFVRTGNWNLVRRLRGTPYLMPEGHIHYFTPNVMRAMFAEAGLDEARSFNRTWFVWLFAPKALRGLVPFAVFSAFGTLANRFASGFAPFPIGIKVSAGNRNTLIR